METATTNEDTSMNYLAIGEGIQQPPAHYYPGGGSMTAVGGQFSVRDSFKGESAAGEFDMAASALTGSNGLSPARSESFGVPKQF